MYDNTTIKKAQALLTDATVLLVSPRKNYDTSEKIDKAMRDVLRSVCELSTSIVSLEAAEKEREDLFDSLEDATIGSSQETDGAVAFIESEEDSAGQINAWYVTLDGVSVADLEVDCNPTGAGKGSGRAPRSWECNFFPYGGANKKMRMDLYALDCAGEASVCKIPAGSTIKEAKLLVETAIRRIYWATNELGDRS